MDALQRSFLSHSEQIYFCESTANFTLEETAELVGKALGSAVDADAVMAPLGAFHDGAELTAGVSGKLYKGPVDADVAASITPGRKQDAAPASLWFHSARPPFTVRLILLHR